MDPGKFRADRPKLTSYRDLDGPKYSGLNEPKRTFPSEFWPKFLKILAQWKTPNYSIFQRAAICKKTVKRLQAWKPRNGHVEQRRKAFTRTWQSAWITCTEIWDRKRCTSNFRVQCICLETGSAVLNIWSVVPYFIARKWLSVIVSFARLDPVVTPWETITLHTCYFTCLSVSSNSRLTTLLYQRQLHPLITFFY